jgi:hypothetical protein
VLIPLTHDGTYEWTSGKIALHGDAVSLGANTRVIGHAGVSPYRITTAGDEPGVTAVTVSVDVSSFTPPAWFVIERAFTRQRETPGIDTLLRTTPGTGPPGTEVTLEGRHCQAAPASTAVTISAEFSRGNAKPYATVRLPLRGSAYAFRMTFTVPAAVETPGSEEVAPGDRITFVTSGNACRSMPFTVSTSGAPPSSGANG